MTLLPTTRRHTTAVSLDWCLPLMPRLLHLSPHLLPLWPRLYSLAPTSQRFNRHAVADGAQRGLGSPHLQLHFSLPNACCPPPLYCRTDRWTFTSSSYRTLAVSGPIGCLQNCTSKHAAYRPESTLLAMTTAIPGVVVWDAIHPSCGGRRMQATDLASQNPILPVSV